MTMHSTIQFGDVLTDRHGRQCAAPAMSFSAPYWIYQDGVAAVNYGDDEAAASEHYDRLVRERLMPIGNTTPRVLPVCRPPAAGPASRAIAEEVAA